MSSFSLLPILVWTLIAFTPSGLAAGEGDKPRMDLHGDPLPPNAIARMGSMRFRFADGIHSLAFSPDGERLAGCSSHLLILWDVATGKRLREFKFPLADLRAVGFDDEANVLAVGLEKRPGGHSSLDVNLVLLRPELKARPSQVLRFAFHSDKLALSPDGKGLFDLTLIQLHIWNLATGKAEAIALNPKVSTDQALFGDLFTSSLTLSPDHRTVARIDCQTNVIHLQDLLTRKTLWKWGESSQVEDCSHPIFSRDGKRLIVSKANGIFSLDVNGKSPPRRLLGKMASKSLFAVSADGNTVATVDEKHKVIALWDTASGRRTTPEGNEPGMLRLLTYAGNNTLVSVAEDGVVRIWDARSGKFLRRALPDKSLGRIVAVSPQADLLAGETESHRVGVWDIAAKKTLWQKAPSPSTERRG